MRRKYGRDTSRLPCHPARILICVRFSCSTAGLLPFEPSRIPYVCLPRIATVVLIFERFQVSYYLRKKFLSLRNVLRQIRERNERQRMYTQHRCDVVDLCNRRGFDPAFQAAEIGSTRNYRKILLCQTSTLPRLLQSCSKLFEQPHEHLRIKCTMYSWRTL
jgi:hypothetical protein